MLLNVRALQKTMCFHLFINMRFILAQCLQDHLFYVNSFQTDQVNVPTQKRITRSNRIEIFLGEITNILKI